MSLVVQLPSSSLSWKIIEPLTKSADISAKEQNITQRHQTKNLSDIMLKLQKVGSLWQKALEDLLGNRYSDVRSQIIKMLCQSQSLSEDYEMTSHNVEIESLRALEMTKIASRISNEIAMKLLNRTKETAANMVQAPQNMKQASQGMVQALENLISELPNRETENSLKPTILRVKAAFEDACTFWNGMENQCKELSEKKVIADEANIDDFVLHWLALAKLSNSARNSFSIVGINISQAMCTLPIKMMYKKRRPN